MDRFTTLTQLAGNSIYFFQALLALWGAFAVIVVWRRLAQIRFSNEQAQAQFLAPLTDSITVGDFDEARALCENDPRALPQLAALAVQNRGLGQAKVRQLVADRFQRDVISELEYQLTWVYSVIKTAPMLGLLGTVLGMMSAFGKLGGGEKVEASQLADDIAIALMTTFIGLAIAIPLSLAAAAVQIRLRKMEELTTSGLSRVLDAIKGALSSAARVEV